jgi:acetolactate synthase-1/2/3 large subunit
MKTVAHQLVDVLCDFGVDTVFGIPGGNVATIYMALLERPEIRVVTAKHETGAAFMAIGYSLQTGRPGVVIATAGPGITNTLTGLATAFYEHVPLVVLAGEVSRASFGRGAVQEGSSSAHDSVALARRFTKFSAQLNRPGAAAAVLRKALATCYSGRKGPAFLSLPFDVGNQPAARQVVSGTVQSSFEVDGASSKQAMILLEDARQPLILAGAGTREVNSRRALRRLAESLAIPVAVTTKGKGVFPEDHPLYLGLFGFGGHDSVVEYLEHGVDVLLACGTGLNDLATNAWSPLLKPRDAFIQIDIDAAQLGKNYEIDFGLVGPTDMVISRMLEFRQPRVVAMPQTPLGPTFQVRPTSKIGKISTIDVVDVMTEQCPHDAVYTTDMGEHMSIALHYLIVRAGGEFHISLGFGSMGSGICAAIGYQLGAPERRTFALCGDGGFLMYGSELATAVRHGAATTFLLVNDQRLNMVEHGLRDIFGKTPDFSTQLIDFAALARSMGADGVVIDTREQLRSALATTPTRPLVLDIRIDPDVRLTGSQRIAALKQFREVPLD